MQTRSSNVPGVVTRLQSSGSSASQAASHARTNARAVSQQQQQQQQQQRSRPRRSLSESGSSRPHPRSPSPRPRASGAAPPRLSDGEDSREHAADNRSSVASIDTERAQPRHESAPLNSPDSGNHICLCTPAPKIPRPRNAFILYRQNKQAQVAARNPGLPNPEISKIIGSQWQKEPEEVKNFWRHNAIEEKRNHEKQYPGYKYAPRRATKTGLSALRNLSLGDPYCAPGDSSSSSSHCPKCGGRFINMPATPGLPTTTTTTTTDSQTDTPRTPAMPTAMASSRNPDSSNMRGGPPPPPLRHEAWDYDAPDRGYGRDMDMSPRRRVSSLHKRALGEAPEHYGGRGDLYYHSEDYTQMASPSKRPRHYSDGYDGPPPPPPHHHYGPPRQPGSAGGAFAGSPLSYPATPRQYLPQHHQHPQQHPQQQQQQQGPPRDWQYGRNPQPRREAPAINGFISGPPPLGPAASLHKPRVTSVGPGYPSPDRPSPAMPTGYRHPRADSMSPRRRAVTQGGLRREDVLSPQQQSRMPPLVAPPPPPPQQRQQQQQQQQQRLPAVRALGRPVGGHESLRLPPLKTHNVPLPPPVPYAAPPQLGVRGGGGGGGGDESEERQRRESSQASPPHYATRHGSVLSQGEVERRTVEAMVMTIPYANKVDTLLNISPPLGPPAPGSPAEAAVQTRGPVVAVEGTALALMVAVGEAIRDELERSGECAVGLWRNVEGVPGAAGSAPARREAEVVVLSDDEGEKEGVGADKQQQQQQQPKAGENDKAAAGGDVEMSGVAHNQTAAEGNKPQQQQQQLRRHQPNPWLAYMSVIQEWHVKSEEMTKFITTKPPPLSSDSGNNKPRTPVALIQGGYQLMAADRWATRVPIADAYAPVDHWQWMATLWRGIVGPDLFVYVRKSPPEDVEALGVVEFKGPRLMVVRVVGAGGQQPLQPDEKTERRVRFEVMEWVRAGSYKRGFGRFV
ncbi:hypothetical protein RB595_005133 [Gaeumannomyces hyphopodioides]